MSPVHRQLAGDALHLELDSAAEELKRSDVLRATGRNARTLVKQGPLRITLIVVAPHGSIPHHRAPGPVSIQVLDGALRIRVEHNATPVDLGPGQLLIIGSGVEHDVSSEPGGVFLLTVVHPESDASRGREPTQAEAKRGASTGDVEGPPFAHEATSRPGMTASDSVGLTYSCRAGQIWVHYPSHDPAARSREAGWPIGPIPSFYAAHPPNAITAERVGLWRSLCGEM